MVATPETPATAKINAALARLDRSWMAFARQCLTRPNTYATRSVEAAMQGPRYLSLVARDEGACSGHPPDGSSLSLPYYDTLTLVFDLDTGRPVDWRVLLGPQMATDAFTEIAIDGTTIGTIASPKLLELYRHALKDVDCADVLADPAPWARPPVHFIAWLDSRRRSLVLQPVLPNVIAGCAVEAPVSLDDLRRAGAPQTLLEALGTAAAP
jgi:hypothetical protein